MRVQADNSALYSEANFDGVARAILQEWGPGRAGQEEALERAKYLAGINRRGARLVSAVSQLIVQEIQSNIAV